MMRGSVGYAEIWIQHLFPKWHELNLCIIKLLLHVCMSLDKTDFYNKRGKQQDEVKCQNSICCLSPFLNHSLFCTLTDFVILRFSFIENFLCTIITVQQVMGLEK